MLGGLGGMAEFPEVYGEVSGPLLLGNVGLYGPAWVFLVCVLRHHPVTLRGVWGSLAVPL
eukprot:4794509-Pyramimonas_sp.AAC.1